MLFAACDVSCVFLLFAAFLVDVGLLCVACCALFRIDRCLLRVVWCLLCVVFVSCVLFVECCLVACCVVFVVRWLLLIVVCCC